MVNGYYSWSGNRMEADRHLARYQPGTLAARFYAERHRREWSQREFAERAGVREHTVARMEQGVGKPNLGTLEKLAAALDMELAFALTPRPGAAGRALKALRQELRPRRSTAKSVTIRDAACELGISPEQVDSLVASGALEGRVNGGYVRVLWESVARYAEEKALSGPSRPGRATEEPEEGAL